MKWQNIVVIISLLLNISLVLLYTRGIAFGQIGVSVPPLTKGMGYQIIIPTKSVTCIDIENRLGLKRGDVVSITNDLEIGSIILFNKDVALTSTQVQTATDTIKGLIPDITTK